MTGESEHQTVQQSKLVPLFWVLGFLLMGVFAAVKMLLLGETEGLLFALVDGLLAGLAFAAAWGVETVVKKASSKYSDFVAGGRASRQIAVRRKRRGD